MAGDKSRLGRTAAPLITKIQQLFSEDLADENDFLRQATKILRSKLGKRWRGQLHLDHRQAA